jgi:putative ABC transport system permease protein
MFSRDVARFTTRSVTSHRMRSTLTALGIAIGVAAVVILTSMGEGLHQFISSQFNQFGTNILAVQPGKSTTFGISSGIVNTVRPLTIEDAVALQDVPFVTAAAPNFSANAEIEANDRQREVLITGVAPSTLDIFNLDVSIGKFLPEDDMTAPRAVAVLGRKIKEELYGDRNPLGDRIRIAGSKFRVIGVTAARGNIIGFDLDEIVYIPAARCLQLFNRNGVSEIQVIHDENVPVSEIVEGVRRKLIARHGAEDFTIRTQQQMMDVAGSVMDVVKFAVAALGSISLLVGGVGIFTIMTIAVRERTPEIGLLRAIGSTQDQIQRIFLAESIVLAGLGGILGLAIGGGIVLLIGVTLPTLPVEFSIPYILAAEIVAVVIGLIAGVLPAYRAAQLDPLAALRTE